jgi:hypothetical protein
MSQDCYIIKLAESSPQDHLLAGDIAVIDYNNVTPKNGDFVLVGHSEGSSFRRYFEYNGQVTLSFGSKLPLVFNIKDIKIYGVCKMIMREFK